MNLICIELIVFLSAFLLFQIEPIIAKILLPKFGGSYLVWGACVVFFQATLLLGYLYSHLILKKVSLSRYRYFHLILLFLPLFFFPGKSLPPVNLHYHLPMVIDIFWQLVVSIGLVFFVLSTTSLIFQGWLAASELSERSNPYILYAVSNLGSFAALLTYPLLFEIFFDLDMQLFIWRLAYLVLLVLHFFAIRLLRLSEKNIKEKVGLSYVKNREKVYWLLLGAAGVIMFLSVTNIITSDIAPVPLLWILPLSIYLISFVLNFKRYPWCPRWIKEEFYITVAFSIILFFLIQQRILPTIFEIIGLCLSLFIVCMFCNNSLYQHRPADSRNLTQFYLLISVGSFIGGLLVSWLIPLISTSMIEYLLGLFIISLTLILGRRTKLHLSIYSLRLIVYIVFLVCLWLLAYKQYSVFGFVFIAFILIFIFAELKLRPEAFILSLLAILFLECFAIPTWTAHKYIFKHRNYYGIYKIYDENGKRFLEHGTTIHGAQYLSKARQAEPLMYYHYLTPVGELMTSSLFNFKRIGIIGLGTGTLAAYTSASQYIDFFEIDPDIYIIANSYFSYLKNSRSKINFIFGDARLSLDNVNKQYDLLIIDAFTGDSAPIHLFTVEAMSKYRSYLSRGGIILFHISSRYLDLNPPLYTNAYALKAYICSKSMPELGKADVYPSDWVAVTWDLESFRKLIYQIKFNEAGIKKPIKDFRPWTDKYFNIFTILKLKEFNLKYKEL
jgi:spermidine synthase